jgi:DNA helicase-2/ATP-dependent DNA helicase PcrA
MPALIQNPTPHQRAIFDHVRRGTRNLMVQAVAGSGKTSTIVHAMTLLGEDESAVYLVFNKRNQVEAEERLRGTNVKAMTFNSLGFRALGRGYTLDGDKTRTAWRDMLAARSMSEDEARALSGFCRRLVDLARQVGIGILAADEVGEWEVLCAEHDLSPEPRKGRSDDAADLARGIGLARELLRRMVTMAQTAKVIDFADQIYLPVHPLFRKAARLPRPDRIFVDEAQDLSPVQAELLAAMMGAKVGERPYTDQRIVFVGDRYQAIYGWRGAACDAMDRLAERFQCEELPLSVCWRCAPEIVALAASTGAQIEAAPGKVGGEVVTAEGPVSAKDGQVVICRTTAPLVSAAYRLIRKGRRAVVLGREIGQGLVSLVRKMGCEDGDDVDALRGKVDAWLAKELVRHADREHLQQAAQDKAECVQVLGDMLPEGSRTVADLCAAIERIFSNDQAHGGVTMSTIHKSKGLEWDEVTILDWHKMPAQWARKAWQRKQEVHCQYVAVTRARQRLVMCAADQFEPSK